MDLPGSDRRPVDARHIVTSVGPVPPRRVMERSAALARRSRTVPPVAIAFLAGVLLAAILLPSDPDEAAVTGTSASAGASSLASAPGAGTSESDATFGSGAGIAGRGAAEGGATVPGGGPVASSTESAASATTAQGPVRGVTATEIKIGVANLDSASLAPVCPRCSNGDAADGGVSLSLYDAWHRDGLLPIHGRDIKFINRKYNLLSPEEQRSTCVELAQQHKVFAAVDDNASATTITYCLAKEFHTWVMTGTSQADEDVLRSADGYMFQGAAGWMRMLRNFPRWLDENGLLDGQVLGLYSADGAANQSTIDKSLRPALKRMGVELAVDLRSSGQQDAAVAVQRFRAAGVTVALLLTGTLEFQNIAQQQGYRPKYPAVDTNGLMQTDAVADVSWNPDAMDNQLGFSQEFSDWEKKRPATPKGNPAATYCLDAYSRKYNRELDVFDNDAEIRYVLEVCSALQIVRQAIENAGPVLNDDTFRKGLYAIRDFNTGAWPAVSYGPGKVAGGDLWHTAQYRKAKWPPAGTYWGNLTGWSPLWEQ